MRGDAARTGDVDGDGEGASRPGSDPDVTEAALGGSVEDAAGARAGPLEGAQAVTPRGQARRQAPRVVVAGELREEDPEARSAAARREGAELDVAQEPLLGHSTSIYTARLMRRTLRVAGTTRTVLRAELLTP